MKKLSPWCLAAIATMAPLGALGGAAGALAGHVAVLAITLGIFVGTLSLNRTPSGAQKMPTFAETTSQVVEGAERKVSVGLTGGCCPRVGEAARHVRANAPGGLGGWGMSATVGGVAAGFGVVTTGGRASVNVAETRLKRLEDMGLVDLETLRLILRGDSIVDWHRLHLTTLEEARGLLHTQEIRPDLPADRERTEAVRDEAVAYLRRNFEFAIPRPIENASVEELMLLASGKGHRQVCACTVLKAMHIIHHLDGRELLFMLPMSTQDLFHLVEEKVYRVIGGMLAAGLPITEFIGGRKNKDSLYTKLLSKPETSATTIYDKIRFRIVTRSVDDLLPVLLYLSQRLFAFNYVIPGQSVNTIFHFRSVCEAVPHLRPFLGQFQGGIDDHLTPSDNLFSASNYRVMHFVVDMPVRVPDELLERAPPSARALGPVVFMLCEFQIVDRDTEASNEMGDASHSAYKERQREAVKRRLKLGTREMREPPRGPGSSSGAVRGERDGGVEREGHPSSRRGAKG